VSVTDGGSAVSPAEWDFFVSYVEADRPWAEWIAWQLREAGYQVLKAWDLVPGSNRVVGMNDGIRRAARTVAVLSEDYIRSVYGTTEWQAWAAEPDGLVRKLLVARHRRPPAGPARRRRQHQPVWQTGERRKGGAPSHRRTHDHRCPGRAHGPAPVPT